MKRLFKRLRVFLEVLLLAIVGIFWVVFFFYLANNMVTL